ncbi:MAG: cell division protein ZapA [Nitrospirota bacterium]
MKSAEVEIFGTFYTIKGEEDPEYVLSIARYVDEKMRSLQKKSPATVSAQKIAILTAVNIADELFKLRRRQAEVENIIQKKTTDLFDILEGG